MPNIRTIIRTGFITIAAFVMMTSFPAAVTFADDSSDASSTCTPPSSTQNGVHVPTGSAAKTFTYQCTGQYTGEWTNQYYVYDPTTNTTTPLYSPDYSYNCTTGIWTMDSWDYDAATNQYVEDRVTTSAPSGVTTNCPTTGSSTNGSDTNGGSDTSSSGGTTNSNNGSGTNGSGSTTTTNAGSTTNDNNNTNVNDTNNVTGTATTGDTLVSGNTTGGDATSGNAQDEANVINMLQSSSSSLGTGSNVIVFTDNINGNVNGNLLLDPATLEDVQPTSNSTNAVNNLTVNNSTGETINDNINLGSTSGNADVSSNTSGGSATTGSAQTIANVVNLISSAISSGQSFIGTININGNLDGNILIPQNFVNELMSDNVPTVNVSVPDSSNTNTTNTSSTTNVTNTNNEGITNKVNASAASGSATVSDNTSAGSATSGQANTNITAFNLTGSNVIASNDLLVFVNVTGTWVGMIMNAPAGTTAAEIGGGITKDTTNADSTTTVNNNTNEQINNNITAGSQSGNANVSRNTSAGSATSGNADTAVNLANIENSSFSLSDWFGILFINVFGTWNGSLEVEPTSANVQAVSPSEAGSILNSAAVYGKTTNYVPTSSTTSGSTTNGAGSTTNSAATTEGAVLADKTVKVPSKTVADAEQAQSNSVWKPFVIIGSLVALYIIGDAAVTHRRKNRHIKLSH